MRSCLHSFHIFFRFFSACARWPCSSASGPPSWLYLAARPLRPRTQRMARACCLAIRMQSVAPALAAQHGLAAGWSSLRPLCSALPSLRAAAVAGSHPERRGQQQQERQPRAPLPRLQQRQAFRTQAVPASAAATADNGASAAAATRVRIHAHPLPAWSAVLSSAACGSACIAPAPASSSLHPACKHSFALHASPQPPLPSLASAGPQGW